MAPKICNTVILELELEDQLKARGDLHNFNGRESAAEVAQAVQGANGLLVFPGVPIGEELLAGTPDLKVVATTSVGVNAFDIDLLTKHGVAMCNTPIVLNDAVADLTRAQLIILSRNRVGFEQYSRSGAWGRREPQPALAHDPQQKTIGIVGFGRIGMEVARRAHSLKMNVIWNDVFGEAPAGSPQGDYRSLDDLLKESDFVTLHTDLNPSSFHLIGERELSLMPSSAYLINNARGPVVDQKALTAALEDGTIAGAALDVLEDEPPDPEEPIVSLPNVITFPHIGTATEETRRAMRGLAVENLINVLDGRMPRGIVNPEVLG